MVPEFDLLGQLVADALSHQRDEVADMVGLYALVGSHAPGLVARCGGGCGADIISIIASYQEPKPGLHPSNPYTQIYQEHPSQPLENLAQVPELDHAE